MTSNPKPPKDNARKMFGSHEHNHCIEQALTSAEEKCAENGLRFTPVRRKVLELLLEEHKAIGAYAILDALREAGFGSQPPVAYRALDFLVSHGFAHRIERLNAFVACAHPGEFHAPAFMICTSCNLVTEANTSAVNQALEAAAAETGFKVEQTVIEIEGVCHDCRDADAQ